MRKTCIKNLTQVFVAFALLVPIAGCNGGQAEDKSAASVLISNTNASPNEDLIARVGDQEITFSQLNIMLNSSAMVGLSIPALGTPERNKVIITLLDKAISANLTYLDAIKNGTDKGAEYTTDMKKFDAAILENMYKSRVLIGDIPVSDEEINAFYKSSISPENELSDDLKLAIESKIRKRKYSKLKDSLRDRLRADVEVTVNDDILSVRHDAERTPADVVATIGDRRISWSEVESVMRGADHRATLSAFYIDNDEERLKRLQMYLDTELMVEKARAAGMDKDPEFAKRTAEYRKTHLINIQRSNMIASWQPTDDQLRTFFMDHIDSISIPESRKVQMVVLKTKEEAEAIKARIDKGEITIYQAAKESSIDPNAKNTLGEMGWVSHGTGFEALDDFTFNLEPEVVGGPVESPAGWHLVKVLDVKDAQYQDIDDAETRRLTLRLYMKEKFNTYVVDLRKNDFDVVVYDDVLARHFQKEADFIAELNIKAQQAGSVTEQRQKELEKWVTPPPVIQ